MTRASARTTRTVAPWLPAVLVMGAVAGGTVLGLSGVEDAPRSAAGTAPQATPSRSGDPGTASPTTAPRTDTSRAAGGSSTGGTASGGSTSDGTTSSGTTPGDTPPSGTTSGGTTSTGTTSGGTSRGGLDGTGTGVAAGRMGGPGGQRPLRTPRHEVVGSLERVSLEGEGVSRAGSGAGTAQSDHEAAIATYVHTRSGRVQVPTSALAHVRVGTQVRVQLAGPAPADGTPALDPSDVPSAEERGGRVLATEVAPASTATSGTATGSTSGSAAGSTSGGTAAGSTPGTAPGATPSPVAAAKHAVTIVLVVPAGARADGTTLASLRSAIDRQVSDFWRRQTGGKVTFRVTRAVGWTQVKASCADGWGLWNEVARKIGFTSGARRHLVAYVPAALDGCFAGLGTIGSGPGAGGLTYVRGVAPALIAHELGHNMGLGHSNGLQCDGQADARWTASGWPRTCVRSDYRDWYDVMGISWDRLGTLSTSHAYRLGALRGSAVRTVSKPATATLTTVSAGSGLRSLRVQDPDSGTYVVEYRAATGADAWLTSNWRGLRPGVLVRRDDPDGGTAQTLLLDASPSPASGFDDDWDDALAQGAQLTTASGRVTIRVDERTATQATVSVGYDGVFPARTFDRLGARQRETSSAAVTSAPGVTAAPAPGARRARAVRPVP